MNTTSQTHIIRQKALELGFSFIGIAKAEKMEEESRHFEQWLNNNHHAGLGYMANHFEMRTDPSKLVSGAKTVLSFMFNYYTDQKQQHDETAPKISKYAFGRDYHKVVKKKLTNLIKFMREEIGDFHGRAFVDSAPILERDWAKRSGLGWIGKNTLLINPKEGSYFFLAEIICDLELDYDHPIKDYCGSCTRCIDACPTDAISEEGYILDTNKCISYLTIERKEAIPDEFVGKMEDWMFGCDICQEVCPWTRFSTLNTEKDFVPRAGILEMTSQDWEEITHEVFDTIFEGTPVKRTNLEGLKRNMEFLKRK